MPPTTTETRPFVPGTTGWTAADLHDPEIERRWFEGRYEIISGVLTTMAPAYHIGNVALYRLTAIITRFPGRIPGDFTMEEQIEVEESRVIRADAAFFTPDDERQQLQAAQNAGRKDPAQTLVMVPPTLIIECVSPGHEQHDERTKRRWYAEFGVPNYWLLNPFKRTLKCLVLRDGVYHEDVAGKDDDEIRPSLFPGLVLRLAEIWPM